MKKFILTLGILIVAAVALFFAKGNKQAEQQAAPVEKPAVAVQTLAVTPVEVEDFVQATGTLQAKSQADVRAEVGGIVREVYVTEWVRVSKGTPLARIDSEELKAASGRAKASVEAAKASLAEAKTYQARAERERTRVQNLKQYGLATQQNLDDAETEVAAAASRISAAKAQIAAAEEELRQLQVRTGRTNIVAPISGVISARNANIGEMAGGENAPALFTIIDDSVFDLTVSIPTVDIASLKKGNRAEFAVDAFPGKTFNGTISHINPSVDPASRAVKVHIEVPNPDGLLKSGFFVTSRIFTGSKRTVVLLNRAAVVGMDDAKHTAIIYTVDNNTARKMQVQTGAIRDGAVEILSGLKAGDKVVVRGGFTLKDGDVVAEQK